MDYGSKIETPKDPPGMHNRYRRNRWGRPNRHRYPRLIREKKKCGSDWPDRCKNRCNPSSYEEKNEGDGVENEATESEAEPGKRSRVAQDRGCAGLKSERRQEDAAGNEHEQQERENLGVVRELHSRRSDFLSLP